MNAKVLSDLFISILLLVLLPTRSAGVQRATKSHSLGLLAYIKGSDLWVKELSGGQARQLTTDGHTATPRWSPSGQWLAYLKDSGLWVVRPSDANARTLNLRAKVNTFAWSPVSDTLAYMTHTGSLYVASVGEQQERELVTGVENKERSGFFSLAWSPIGKWLVYVQEQPMEYAGLWRIQADSSKAKEIFNTGTPTQDGLIVAGWSPDGQSILFWPVYDFSSSLLADGTSLMVIPASGGQPVKLVESMLAHDDFLAWSPDGKLLAVTEGSGRQMWLHKRIAVVEPTSGTLTYLTDDKTAAFSPAWSPDEQRIAYIAAPDISFVGGSEEAKAGTAQRRIWVMNRDGSAQRQLTHDAAYRDERPLWAADGKHLLFARLDQQGWASLWLMRSDGSKLQQVAELSPAPEWFGYYGYISWGGYFDWWLGAPQRAGAKAGALGSVKAGHR